MKEAYLPTRGSSEREAGGNKTDNTKQPESGSLVALNFKVSPETKKDFKVWAAAHNKTQREVLEEAFRLLQKHYL